MKLQRDLHNNNSKITQQWVITLRESFTKYQVVTFITNSSEKPSPKQLHQLWTVGVDKYIITVNATSTQSKRVVITPL